MTTLHIACAHCGTENRVPAARLAAKARCGGCRAALLPLARPLPVTSEESFDAVVASATVPVVVDFWAAWCGPCRAVAPELEKLAASKTGAVVVLKVDTEALPRLAGRYGIRGIPTFIAFRGGRETARTSGAMPAPALAAELGV